MLSSLTADGFIHNFGDNKVALLPFILEPSGAIETFNVITLDLSDVKTLAGETVTHGG